jgi:hypothetical protein
MLNKSPIQTPSIVTNTSDNMNCFGRLLHVSNDLHNILYYGTRNSGIRLTRYDSDSVFSPFKLESENSKSVSCVATQKNVLLMHLTSQKFKSKF